MRRALAAAVLVATLIGVAVVVFGGEKVEHVVHEETAPFREPEGEWMPSVAGSRAELWAVGDSGPPNAEAVVTLIAHSDPDRVLYLGDVYPGGTPSEFREWADAWDRLAPITAPTPGNHEWPDATEGYDPYWKRFRGAPPPTYYSFRAAGWEVLVLNSEHDEQDPQADWIESHDRGACRIATWHEPRFSAGPRGDNGGMDDLWNAARGRVRAVLSGHEHNMQRMKPIDGIVQFVSGAGGQSHQEVDTADRRLAFSNDDAYGALRLVLSPGRARWQFVAVGGEVLDSGSLRCRA